MRAARGDRRGPAGARGRGEGCQAGFLGRLPARNALATLYGACRDARRAFDELAEQDVVLWTVLFSAFVRGGRFAEALGVFAEMDVAPNEVTLATVLGHAGGWGGEGSEGSARLVFQAGEGCEPHRRECGAGFVM